MDELEPGFGAIPLELLSTFETTLDEEFCVAGVSGDSESEQAVYIDTAPTARMVLNKRFFIIFLFHILSKIRFS
jgi:hypothetical protein